MLVAALRQRILELAIQGKLVPQSPDDGNAEDLYQQIQQEKKKLIAAGKLKKQKPLPPITQEETPFDIPESWKWVRLQSICARFSTGPFGSMLHKRDYVPKGIPVVNPTNIIRGRIDTSKVQRVGEKTCDRLAVFQLNIDDIVLARRGNLSKCAPVGDSEKGWLCGTGSFVIHPVKVLSQWLCYYYVSRYSQHYLLADSVGNTMDNLNQGLLSQLPIALPPFSEQQRIVERVQALFAELDAIEQSQERVAAIQAELNKRILERAIQGKLVPQRPEEGTAEELYQQIQREKKKLIAAGQLKKEKPLRTITEEEIPFNIPESWKWVRLGDVVQYRIGKTPPRGELTYWNDGKTPWVSIADMADAPLIADTKEKINEYAAEHTFKGKIAPEGTLLMSFKLTVGRTSILGVPAYHNEAIISIYPLVTDKNAMKRYLFHALPILATRGETKSAVKGRTLNTDSINALLIPLPPIDEQLRIAEKMEEMLAYSAQ